MENIDAVLCLYDICPLRGFLRSNDPLYRLPSPYLEWENTADRICGLIVSQQTFRVSSLLPVLDASLLLTVPEFERAMLVLCIIAHACVFEVSPSRNLIPSPIAIPLLYVSNKLQRPPVLSHASIVLSNYRRIDSTLPVKTDNITTINQFVGGQDEAWFYLLTAEIEYVGAPLLLAALKGQRAITFHKMDEVIFSLKVIHDAIVDMHHSLLRMQEKNDPYIFYSRVRPFLASLENVVYEGSNLPAMSLHGGSAAQSSIIQVADIFLGIAHAPSANEFLIRMREYMPKRHRDFLEYASHQPSIRDYCLENGGDLLVAYGNAVSALKSFRDAHLQIVALYIVSQKANAGPGQKGTGGTSPMLFLKQSRDDTSNAIP